ncbi:MAG: DUF4926 domain-containing protein [Cyanobacteriota bacterium]|nr:DUF4926 domain-containing protein [Cyanobacteriota bacterium]
MKPALFDRVELLVELPEVELHPGDRGAIVESYAEGKYEIEFSNPQGETLALQVLSPEQFSVVWQATTQRWLSVSEQLAILLDRLSDERQQDVLQFARSLIGAPN